MSSGPKFNNIKRDFATRNSMWYDEVINSLQDQASPIITNVTDNIYYTKPIHPSRKGDLITINGKKEYPLLRGTSQEGEVLKT